MQFLSELGQPIDINVLPENLTTDCHFAALVDDDIQFYPLIFLECWRERTATVTIGATTIDLPLDMSIAVFCPHTGDIETIPLIEADGWSAFGFDPFRSTIPDALPMRVKTSDKKRDWKMPRRLMGMTVAVPVGNLIIWIGNTRVNVINVADLI